MRRRLAAIAVGTLLLLAPLGPGTQAHAATLNPPQVVATASVGSCIFGGVKSVGATTSTWSAIRNGIVRSPMFVLNAFWCLGPGSFIRPSGELA